jgi:hypothetical protein
MLVFNAGSRSLQINGTLVNLSTDTSQPVYETGFYPNNAFYFPLLKQLYLTYPENCIL